MMLKLLVDGGDMKPGPVVAQQLGPVGLNIGQVIQKVNSATTEFKGMKVPVTLVVNTKTKDFDVKVSSPPSSELIKKELGVEKGSSASKNIKAGNLSIEQVVLVAKIKQAGMIVKDFKSAVKSILGSCVSLGVLVESKDASEVLRGVNEGVYDGVINSQKTEVSPEKKKELDDYFALIKERQDKVLKKEAEDADAKKKSAEKPVVAATTAKTPAKAPAKDDKAKPAGKSSKKK